MSEKEPKDLNSNSNSSDVERGEIPEGFPGSEAKRTSKMLVINELEGCIVPGCAVLYEGTYDDEPPEIYVLWFVSKTPPTPEERDRMKDSFKVLLEEYEDFLTEKEKEEIPDSNYLVLGMDHAIPKCLFQKQEGDTGSDSVAWSHFSFRIKKIVNLEKS
jgi:hypothetical protein